MSVSVPTKFSKRSACSVMAFVLVGCSTDAYVYRPKFDTAIEGRIVSSDLDSVRVQLADGTTASVPRSEIGSIDHPGNVLAVAGLCVLLMGLQIIATEPHDNEELAITGSILGVPGLTMLAWGGATYVRSSRAADTLVRERVSAARHGPRVGTPATDRPYLPAPTWDQTQMQGKSEQ